LIGGMVEYSKLHDWQPYPTTFLVLGIGISLTGVFLCGVGSPLAIQNFLYLLRT